MDLNIKDKLPKVSVCTPTFNRRPFIEHMIKCFDSQTYPKDKMEWIIVDDGTDRIKDLVEGHPNVRYFELDEKVSIGKKRNIINTKVTGDIIVNMDDDDYYPPERVSHAVEMLMNNPEAMCAGCSEIYTYFNHIDKIVQFGPYNSSHATANTFAFRKQLVLESSYDDDASLAEEKSFLKNYTVPFVQLDPVKTILVISHKHNSFDKRKLLQSPNQQFVKVSDKVVDTFMKDPVMKQFYMVDVQERLNDYEPGQVCKKPDVLINMLRIEEDRRKHAEQMAKNMVSQGSIMIQQHGCHPTALNGQDIIRILKEQKEANNRLNQLLRIKEEEIVLMGNEILRLKSGTQTDASQAPNPSNSYFESHMKQINK